MSDGIDALYRQHAPAGFRRARRLLGDDADAHEVVHDLLLSLFERPDQFRGAGTMTTFLYAATTNACLNRLRNAQAEPSAADPAAVPMATRTKPPPKPTRTGPRCHYWPWALLMRLTLGLPVDTCPHCGGRMKLRALVRDRESIERFLRRQNLWTKPLG